VKYVWPCDDTKTNYRTLPFPPVFRSSCATLVEKKQAGDGDETLAPEKFAEAIEAFLDEELDHKALIRDQHIDAAQLDEYMFELIRGVRM
jgi:hypothetical protein